MQISPFENNFDQNSQNFVFNDYFALIWLTCIFSVKTYSPGQTKLGRTFVINQPF